MRVIEVGEKVDFLPDNTVKGVELEGSSEALVLAKSLGHMAYETLRRDVTDPIRVMSEPNAIEALRLQNLLFENINRQGTTDEPFTFRAVDEVTLENLLQPNINRQGFAGRILRSAVEKALETQREPALT